MGQAHERSDDELIAAIDAGDSSAFAALYHRHRDYVLRLARRTAGHDDDALDVLQETFAYLHRKFPGFRLTCRMTTFLFPVVRNLAIAARRKRTRSIGVGERDIDLPDTSAVPPDLEPLHRALASLSPPHREVVLLRFVDDLSTDEIATALDIPPGTVKSRLHHALKQLREDPGTLAYFS